MPDPPVSLPPRRPRRRDPLQQRHHTRPDHPLGLSPPPSQLPGHMRRPLIDQIGRAASPYYRDPLSAVIAQQHKRVSARVGIPRRSGNRGYPAAARRRRTEGEVPGGLLRGVSPDPNACSTRGGVSSTTLTYSKSVAAMLGFFSLK
jgi:hypothetical protein